LVNLLKIHPEVHTRTSLMLMQLQRSSASSRARTARRGAVALDGRQQGLRLACPIHLSDLYRCHLGAHLALDLQQRQTTTSTRQSRRLEPTALEATRPRHTAHLLTSASLALLVMSTSL